MKLVVIMGVSGCGKTSVARALSQATGFPFLEGDDFHSADNVSKMTSGTALTNEDRVPWVAAICEAVEALDADTVILACSALTRFVQEALREGQARKLKWVLLEADVRTLRARMEVRDHFMPLSLLESQLEALTPPKDALRLDATDAVDELVSEIQKLCRIST